MNIRKILKEEMDEFEWARQTVESDLPSVYAVYYESVAQTNFEGYFTMKAFDHYLDRRNQEREAMDESPEEKDEFVFKKININW
jgi:hypothetical protein